jgi:hypothetical protein
MARLRLADRCVTVMAVGEEAYLAWTCRRWNALSTMSGLAS